MNIIFFEVLQADLALLLTCSAFLEAIGAPLLPILTGYFPPFWFYKERRVVFRSELFWLDWPTTGFLPEPDGFDFARGAAAPIICACLLAMMVGCRVFLDVLRLVLLISLDLRLC